MSPEDREKAGQEGRFVERSTGPCFATPVGYPHVHCDKPLGHGGLHRCLLTASWGDNSAIEFGEGRESQRD